MLWEIPISFTKEVATIKKMRRMKTMSMRGEDADLGFLRFGAMPLDHHRDFLVAIDTEGAFLRAFATTLDIREASAHWST